MVHFCWPRRARSHTGTHSGVAGIPAAHYARVLCGLALCLSLLATLPSAPVYGESNEATAVDVAFGHEYAVPNGPRNMAVEAPGRIWYTAREAGGIGLLEVISSPDEPAVRYRTEFYGLGEISYPYDIVYHDGVVWFTLQGIRSLGHIDVATREIKTYALLSVGAAPTGLDVEPTGELWIAQNNGRISRFDPVTETFTEFIMSNTLAQQPRIEDIVYQNSRAVWFTMPDANLVVTYDPVRDRFFETPVPELQPMGITLDPQGQIWITAFGSSRVGRYTPTTVSIWIWYETPTPDSGPTGVLVFDSGNSRHVWTTDSKTGTIGRVSLQNGFELVNSERVGPNNPAGSTLGIIRAPDGHIWVADAGRNLLYELTPPYIQRTYITTIVKEAPLQ